MVYFLPYDKYFAFFTAYQFHDIEFSSLFILVYYEINGSYCHGFWLMHGSAALPGCGGQGCLR
jgi:hypothetical protein